MRKTIGTALSSWSHDKPTSYRAQILVASRSSVSSTRTFVFARSQTLTLTGRSVAAATRGTCTGASTAPMLTATHGPQTFGIIREPYGCPRTLARSSSVIVIRPVARFRTRSSSTRLVLPRREPEQAPRPQRESGGSDGDDNEERIRRHVWPFDDDTPDVRQGEQPKDCTSGHDISFHERASRSESRS